MRLRFEKEGHTYHDDDIGLRIPGTSEVLRSASLLDGMPDNPSYMVAGSYIHEAIVLALDNDLKWDEVPVEDRPFVEAAVRAVEREGMTVRNKERLVGSQDYRVATMIDAEVTMGGLHYVVNWKTSRTGKDYPHYKYQMALEALCADEDLGGHHERLAILLKPDGSYAPIIYKNPEDLPIVKAACLTYWAGRKAYGDRLMKARKERR